MIRKIYVKIYTYLINNLQRSGVQLEKENKVGVSRREPFIYSLFFATNLCQTFTD